MQHTTCSPPLTNSITMESSAIAQVAYDWQRRIMQIEFRDGGICQYAGVSLHTYQELLKADSKGGYFNRNIRPKFSHTVLRSTKQA
jgi:hypothetical protein